VFEISTIHVSRVFGRYLEHQHNPSANQRNVMGFKDMPADNIKAWRNWHDRDHLGKWSTCCYEPCRSATPKFRNDWDNQ
jgi:hypothetical protein